MGKEEGGQSMTVVHGWDLSLRHGGFVELNDGEVSWFRYVTDRAGAAKKSKEHGQRLNLSSKINDRDVLSAVRIAWWEKFIWQMLDERKPDYVGIEDYALDQAQGAHHMGEVGGVARLILMLFKIPYRLHQPGTIKMFTAHNGNAGKNQMVKAVKSRWGADFNQYDQPIKVGAKKGQDTTVSEDLSDAMAIAKMIWAEVQLRRGDIRTSDLEHEAEVRVFNRTTKAHPTNLLDRDWTQPPRG